MGHHRFKQWLIACRRQAIYQADAGFTLERPCGPCPKETSYVLSMQSMLPFYEKVLFLELLLHIPETTSPTKPLKLIN